MGKRPEDMGVLQQVEKQSARFETGRREREMEAGEKDPVSLSCLVESMQTDD